MGCAPGREHRVSWPHGPLGTDTINARGLARDVAEAVDGLLFPAIPVTCCPGYSVGYRGTLAVDRSVTAAYLEEIIEAAVRNDTRKLVVIIAHGGAVEVVHEVGRRIGRRHADLVLVGATWWRTLPAGFGASIGFTQRDGGGHGGPRETAVAMW